MTVKTKKLKRTRSAVIYKWRGGGGFNGVPAQAVGEELARLEITPGDYHRTPDILDAARHPDSPLHGCFVWDDEKAGELHRLQQCRHLLRSIAVVVIRGENRTKRSVYCHVTDDEGPRYVRAETVAKSEDMKKNALDEVLAMLNGIRKRFDFISELSSVFEAIDRVTERLNG